MNSLNHPNDVDRRTIVKSIVHSVGGPHFFKKLFVVLFYTCWLTIPPNPSFVNHTKKYFQFHWESIMIQTHHADISSHHFLPVEGCYHHGPDPLASNKLLPRFFDTAAQVRLLYKKTQQVQQIKQMCHMVQSATNKVWQRYYPFMY